MSQRSFFRLMKLVKSPPLKPSFRLSHYLLTTLLAKVQIGDNILKKRRLNWARELSSTMGFLSLRKILLDTIDCDHSWMFDKPRSCLEHELGRSRPMIPVSEKYVCSAPNRAKCQLLYIGRSGQRVFL